MVETDEDALICDLAEIYGIYDYKSLPPLTVATLCRGLGIRSRVLGKASGLTCPPLTFMMAHALDVLDLLLWQNTEDGHKGRNQPERRTANLKQTEKNETFTSPEAFEVYRAGFFTTPERGD